MSPLKPSSKIISSSRSRNSLSLSFTASSQALSDLRISGRSSKEQMEHATWSSICTRPLEGRSILMRKRSRPTRSSPCQIPRGQPCDGEREGSDAFCRVLPCTQHRELAAHQKGLRSLPELRPRALPPPPVTARKKWTIAGGWSPVRPFPARPPSS